MSSKSQYKTQIRRINCWNLHVYCMYRQFNVQQFYVLPTQCIYRSFATRVSQLRIWHFL